MEDIAAITNSKGNVLAIMPHPERALYSLQKPDWISRKNKMNNKLLYKSKLYADGYKIFKNAYNYFK
jgi:phosphoribosylformylglycinamidine synthase